MLKNYRSKMRANLKLLIFCLFSDIQCDVNMPADIHPDKAEIFLVPTPSFTAGLAFPHQCSLELVAHVQGK